jgi:protein-disulfide isomerase
MMRCKKFIAFVLVGVGVSTLSHAADNDIVAKVGDQVLTQQDMQKDMAVQLYNVQNQIYTIEKGWIDKKAQDILFAHAAKEAGLTPQQWEEKEINAKASAPTQQEITQAVSQATRNGGSASTDTIKMATEWLTKQKQYQQRQIVYQELQKKYPVEVLLTKPEAPKVNVTYGPEDPVMGPANAPVTVIEFTDFQCPYCRRSQSTLIQVEEAYKGKIKMVAKQYPLPFHPRAKPAAEAALCAKEQGKYWEYRDKLFGVVRGTAAVTESQEIPPAHLEDADFQRYAKELGLNERKFNKCIADHRYAAQIDKDIAEGQKNGVNGTPSFFVNGKGLVGAQPYDAFKESIDEALAKK